MSFASVAIVTPTYGPDLSRCELLVESVRRCGVDADHYLIVTRKDRARFEHLQSDRTHLMDAESLLPDGLRPIPGQHGAWHTPKAPPISGWVVQQLLKIACAQQLSHDTLLFCDSDMFFVRPFGFATLQVKGKLGLLDVDHQSAEIGRWSAIAFDLLGVEPDCVPVRNHINTMISWNRRHVLSMIERIQSRSDIDWRYRIARLPTFSECTLYGIYVRSVIGYERSAHAPSHRPLVRGSWGLDLRDPAAMASLFSELHAETVAVMVHSKDGVQPAAYRHHAERCWGMYSR
jgi:hypothetical protein